MYLWRAVAQLRPLHHLCPVNLHTCPPPSTGHDDSLRKPLVSRKLMLEFGVGFVMACLMHRRCPEDIKQAQQTTANGKEEKCACVCVCEGVFSFVGLLIFKEIHLGKEILLPPHDIASFPTSLLTCVFVTKAASSGSLSDPITWNPRPHNWINIPERKAGS